MRGRKGCLCGLLLCWSLVSASAAFAEQRTLTLPDGMVAVADYRAGEDNKPAVLVLHGFLQTNTFSTVRLITDSLHSSGYTVLAPNLTLGMNRRTAPLACDALQRHNVEQGNKELHYWLAWLQEQGHRHVILTGHGSGGSQLVSFLSRYPSPNVIAFFPLAIGPMQGARNYRDIRLQTARARAMLAAGDPYPGYFSIGVCRNNYRALAKDFLSYLEWSDGYLLGVLRSLSLPVTVVLGSEDNWLPPDWKQRLHRQGTPLHVIDGASHYFTGDAESVLLQALHTLLENSYGN